jgi:outer membrane lipoprotein SlyB
MNIIDVNFRIILAAFIFAALLMLTACATDPQMSQIGEESVRYGEVIEIEPIELQGDHQLGVGAIVGAAAGGLLGSQIGHGTGRDVATVAGVIGGGLLGNRVENRYVDKRAGQHVTVRLRNGVTIAVTQPTNHYLRVGDLVRVEGSGQHARVVRS